MRKSHPSATALGAALLLHGLIAVVVLTAVRLPVAPVVGEQRGVAVVFAAPEPAVPVAAVPAVVPDPPVAPVAPPAPAVVTEAPASPVGEAPAAPRGAGKAAPRRKVTAKPMSGQAPRPDATAGQPGSRPAAAEAPIAGDWQRALAAWLAAHKTYPDEARREGKEGSVVLRFTVDRSGHVLDVVVMRSAGSATLDRAAEAMVRDATLPPFSAGMAQEKITITVQIRYALTD